MPSNSGVKKDALNISGTAGLEGQNALNAVNPIYQQEAEYPTGYSPTDLAGMRTSIAQTGGGGVASAVGQGGLLAARTNSAGGAAAAIDDASRQAGVNASQNQLEVDNQNAKLREAQRQSGLSGLNSIYDTASGQSISALNTANQAKPFWQSLATSLVPSFNFQKQL
jgi:hypothetical protein